MSSIWCRDEGYTQADNVRYQRRDRTYVLSCARASSLVECTNVASVQVERMFYTTYPPPTHHLSLLTYHLPTTHTPLSLVPQLPTPATTHIPTTHHPVPTYPPWAGYPPQYP